MENILLFSNSPKKNFPYTDNILVCFSSLYFYSSVSISADAAFSYMMACSDEHSHHGTFFSYGITAATFVNTCILKQSEWKTKMILFSCLNSPELAEVLSEDFQGFLQEVLNGVTFLHLKQKYTNGEKTKAWGEKPVCKVLLRTVQITFFFSLKSASWLNLYLDSFPMSRAVPVTERNLNLFIWWHRCTQLLQI